MVLELISAWISKLVSLTINALVNDEGEVNVRSSQLIHSY